MTDIITKESNITVLMGNGTKVLYENVKPEEVNVVTLGDVPNSFAFLHIFDRVHNRDNYIPLGIIIAMSVEEVRLITTPGKPNLTIVH